MKLDQDILDQVTLENERERDTMARQVLAEADELLRQNRDILSDSQRQIDTLFKAAEYAPVSPFTPPDAIPGYDQATYHELKNLAVEQSRALDVAELVAKNHVKVERVEGLYADAALIQAQTTTKHQNITNEGLKLQQAIQVGRLITVKTEGLLIETQTQETKNLTARRLLELEAERGNALIEGAAIEIEEIRANNNARLIEGSRDFAALKSAMPMLT